MLYETLWSTPGRLMNLVREKEQNGIPNEEMRIGIPIFSTYPRGIFQPNYNYSRTIYQKKKLAGLNREAAAAGTRSQESTKRDKLLERVW